MSKKVFKTPVEMVLQCSVCKAEHSVIVEHEDYIKYSSGVGVAEAFPYLGSKDKDILKLGCCYPCLGRLIAKAEV